MNALTYPWIVEALGRKVKFTAIDVDSELADFQNKIFKNIGYGEQAMAVQGDILVDKPIEADVAFMFKLLPLLEHQEKGSAKKVVNSIPSKIVVVSYPTKSISGKSKGMLDNYREFMNQLIVGESWGVEEVLLDGELLYIINKI
jgi:16S rRNA (guanine(1405)-N(7))-methyltransferase